MACLYMPSYMKYKQHLWALNTLFTSYLLTSSVEYSRFQNMSWKTQHSKLVDISVASVAAIHGIRTLLSFDFRGHQRNMNRQICNMAVKGQNIDHVWSRNPNVAIKFAHVCIYRPRYARRLTMLTIKWQHWYFNNLWHFSSVYYLVLLSWHVHN